MAQHTWTVELHAHSIYSKDCLVKPGKLVELAQQKGIDRLAITDHNEVTGGLELARLHPMLIIPGIEVKTTKGELLAWLVQEAVPRGLSPQETIQMLRRQGAIIGVPHPFDRYRTGAWREEDLIPIVRDIDVIEVFNARCIHDEDNQRALAFARQHNLLMTCGSDAHSPGEYGQAVMRVPAFANTADGLRDAISKGERVENLSPRSVHLTSTWARWVKRLGLVKQPGT